MAEFRITGRMKVSTVKETFFEEFGANLRIYDGNKLADDNDTIASIRNEDFESTGDFSVKGNTKVKSFEKKMLEEFGIKVKVATKDDKRLADGDATLSQVGQGEGKTEKAKKSEEEVVVEEAENLDWDASNIKEPIIRCGSESECPTMAVFEPIENYKEIIEYINKLYIPDSSDKHTPFFTFKEKAYGIVLYGRSYYLSLEFEKLGEELGLDDCCCFNDLCDKDELVKDTLRKKGVCNDTIIDFILESISAEEMRTRNRNRCY